MVRSLLGALTLSFLLAGAGPSSKDALQAGDRSIDDRPDAAKESSGDQAVDRVFELVFQIKTAVSAEASKASYGSGFVVGTDGLLATNFHVVSQALHEPEKYKIFLVDGAQSIEATVVKVNVINDLALIRVARRFPRAVTMAAKMPRPGEKVYALGLPEDLNKSVIEGNFNGVVSEGPYEKVQMSIPLNAGMSGGPTVNQVGEVIGVNVAVLLFAQNLAFAVPRSQLQALLLRQEQSYQKRDGVKPIDGEIERQLNEVQDRLTGALRVASTASLKLPGFTVNAVPPFLKCWRTSDDGVKEKWLETSEECQLGNAAMITEERYGGTFRTRYTVIENKKLNRWQFFNLLESRAVSDSASAYAERFSTPFDCDDADIVNAQGIPLKVQYCLNTFVKMSGLYDVDFVAVTMLPEGRRALVVSGYFSGFSADNAQALVKLYLDGVRAD